MFRHPVFFNVSLIFSFLVEARRKVETAFVVLSYFMTQQNMGNRTEASGSQN
jgi:hypothetical protein